MPPPRAPARRPSSWNTSAGAVARGPDSAFGARTARYNVNLGADWTDIADTDAHVAWARAAGAAVDPHSLGTGYLTPLHHS